MKVNHIRVLKVATNCFAKQPKSYPLTDSMSDDHQLYLEQSLLQLTALKRYEHRKKKPHENRINYKQK